MSNSETVDRGGRQSKPVRKQFNYKGGLLASTFVCLPCGIYVQVGKSEWIGPKNAPLPFVDRYGAVYVTNAELKDRTGGETELMRSRDIFVAFFQHLHTVDRYGVDASRPGTEANELEEAVTELRDDVPAVLAGRPPDIAKTSGVLNGSRNAHKLRAGVLLSRALRILREGDATGRKNPTGALMVSGATIGEILKRLNEMRGLDAFIRDRGQVLLNLLKGPIELYDRMWSDLFQMSHDASAPSLHDLLAQAKQATRGLSDAAVQRGPEAIRAMKARLISYRQRVQAVTVAPFRRNAYHLERDLDQLLGACRLESLDEMERHLDRIKNGMRWEFALAHLEMRVIMPLAIQLVLEEQDWNNKKRSLTNPLTFDEYLGSFSQHFAEVETEFHVFRDRLWKSCSDFGLKRPVMLAVSRQIELVEQYMKDGNWLRVKEELDAIPPIL